MQFYIYAANALYAPGFFFLSVFDFCTEIFQYGIPLLPYADSSMTIPLFADFVGFSYSDVCSPFNQDVIIISMTVPHYYNIFSFHLLLNKKKLVYSAALFIPYSNLLFSFPPFIFPLFIPMAMPSSASVSMLSLCLLVFLPGVLFADRNYGNVTSFF